MLFSPSCGAGAVLSTVIIPFCFANFNANKLLLTGCISSWHTHKLLTPDLGVVGKGAFDFLFADLVVRAGDDRDLVLTSRGFHGDHRDAAGDRLAFISRL